MQPSTLAKRGSLLLFLVITGFYLYGLGHIPLLGPDEPRYAQVAREMFVRRDLITPTLGGHTWFEKPALLYWLMMLSYKLFGVSEWSARLPSALSGILTAAGVFVIARRVEQTTSDNHLQQLGRWTLVATSSTLGFVVFSRAATFDILLTLTITWSFAFFILHELTDVRRTRTLLLVGFYCLIGVALLAKGFVGAVIPAGVLGVYYLLSRKKPDHQTMMSVFWGAPLAVAVAALWYGPVIRQHGHIFIDQFIWQHQFARYLSNTYRHPGPVYYYLAVLGPISLPWTAFLIGGLARATNRLSRPGNASGDSSQKLVAFAFAWLVMPLVFFSFSSSKLPGYLLPALPGAALIVGERLTQLIRDRQSNTWKLKVTGILCVLGAIALMVYAWSTERSLVKCSVLIATVLILTGGTALLTTRHRGFAVAATALAMVITVCALSQCIVVRADRESSKRLVQLADARGYSQAYIYGLTIDDRSPEFYAAGRVVYTSSGEPVIYDGAPHLVNECKRGGTVLLAFIPLDALNELMTAHTVETEIVGDNRRVVLVAVKPR